MAKTKTAKATKGARVAEKAVLELAQVLDSGWYTGETLDPYVAKLGDPKGLALAEAALAKVKKGLRRTYLAARVAEAEGDAAGAAKLATEFCKAYGALDRGRLTLGSCFCNVAPLSPDALAVHAGVRCLADADPYFSLLYDVAVANADARGDAKEAAMWRTRAATFARVRPVLLDLRKDTEEQALAKAIAAVDALPDEDRRFVMRRAAYRADALDEGVARRAVLETLDDGEVSSVSWVMSLGEVGDDDEDGDASKALRALVEKDPALVLRLVSRLEEADAWPQTTDDDGEVEEDAVYKGTCTAFHALRERAGDERVFSLTLRALSGGKEKTRLQRAVMETFLHGLHCGPQAWPTMTDAQARTCFEWLYQASRKGPHENDARHALFYWARPGIEALLEQALEKETIEDVVENLYATASHVGARDILVRRIPKEKKEFWRLQDAIGELWNPAWHAQLLDQIDEWNDARLAEIYLEALRDHVKKNGAIVDLVRRVLAWKMPSGDGARYLKRVLLEGARAAIDVRAYALAKEAHGRAQAIKGNPLSNEYTTERKTKVPDPFEDKDDKKKLTRLLSGELEKAEERERQKLAEARASGKPRKATDETLAALAGADVAVRVFEDGATHEVLFKDAEGALQFYDGYALVAPPWELEPLESLPRVLAGVTRCNGRALAWDKQGHAYREILRWGDRVMVLWGLNNDYAPEGRVVSFPNEDAARAFEDKVRSAAPAGLSYGSGYHAATKGGVAREYVNAGTDADDDSPMQAVVGARWSWGNRRFDSPEQAEHAYEAWELDLYKKGARLKNLEWMERLKRDEDMSLREWLDERARDDEMTVRWHMDALPEIERALRAQGVWPEGAEASLGSPCGDSDIAVFGATVEVLPGGLDELWRTVGSARWKVGARSQRVLAPAEAIAYRPKMKAYLDAIVQKWGSKRERLEPVWREADALVVDQDDKPITVMRCTKAAGTNLYSDMHERPTDAFWTDTLAWQLCTTFTDAYVRALADAEPAIHYLKYGECAGAGRKTVSLASGDKVWHAILDERAAMFVTIAGKKGGSLRAARKKSKDAASARKAFDAAVKGKRAEGFR